MSGAAGMAGERFRSAGLTASLNSCSAFRKRNEAACPPRISKEKVEPAPLLCARKVFRRRSWRPGMTDSAASPPSRGRVKVGDRLGVAVGFLHTQRQRLQRAAQHPAGVRIKLGADRAAQGAHLRHQRFAAHRRAGDQIGMAADIFGQRVKRYPRRAPAAAGTAGRAAYCRRR